MTPRAGALAAAAALLLAGCSADAPPPAPAAASVAPQPEITLPPDALLPLVPPPGEVPDGLVPVLAGSGPREVADIAAFSADPAAAEAALVEHGFTGAYVAQYADPADGRVLSVVAVRFADAAGAQADLEGDLADPSGEPVELPTVGEVSQARRQPLPGSDEGALVTLRFRSGATTWLLAYGGPETTADAAAEVAAELGRALVSRAPDA